MADGVEGDRENSYAWSMEIFDNYLYVGSNRNVVGSILARYPGITLPDVVPTPSNNDGRIFRMSLRTGVWERFFTGPGLGFRMMKTFATRASGQALFVGTMGTGACDLLAIPPSAATPTSIFHLDAPGSLPLRMGRSEPGIRTARGADRTVVLEARGDTHRRPAAVYGAVLVEAIPLPKGASHAGSATILQVWPEPYRAHWGSNAPGR
jgi:hypothetical protein